MYNNITKITDEVLGGYLNLLATYYDLHTNPELSFCEWQTAERLSALHCPDGHLGED